MPEYQEDFRSLILPILIHNFLDTGNPFKRDLDPFESASSSSKSARWKSKDD
jgi:hypothetical protein